MLDHEILKSKKNEQVSLSDFVYACCNSPPSGSKKHIRETFYVFVRVKTSVTSAIDLTVTTMRPSNN